MLGSSQLANRVAQPVRAATKSVPSEAFCITLETVSWSGPAIKLSRWCHHLTFFSQKRAASDKDSSLTLESEFSTRPTQNRGCECFVSERGKSSVSSDEEVYFSLETNGSVNFQSEVRGGPTRGLLISELGQGIHCPG